jgi:hypothetical protein
MKIIHKDLSSDTGLRWEFKPENGKWTKIQVPAGGWRAQGHRCDAGTYRTRLGIPASAQGQTIRLAFAAINFGAKIFIGEDEAGLTLIGSHVNGWVPVTVDLTPHVVAGREYSLVVEVLGRNKYKRMRWIPQIVNGKKKLVEKECFIVPEAAAWLENMADGILRGVELQIFPSVFLDEPFVITSVTDDTLHPEITVCNTTGQTIRGKIKTQLGSASRRRFKYPALTEMPITLEPHERRTFDLTATRWGLGPESYWWPNVPYQAGYRSVLHNLTFTLEVAGRPVHTVTQRFGFRQFQVKGCHYYLNGIRCNLRGDNQQEANFGTDAYGIFPGFGPPSKGNPGWPAAVDNLQQLNFNVLRIHQVPCTPYMLDVCDELGLMIVDETPIRGSEGVEDYIGGWDTMLNAAKELALRDRNHPSMVIFSAANEIWYQRRLSMALQGAVWSVDQTRPVIIDGLNDTDWPEVINMEHYTSGCGVYPEGGTPRTTRPYGETESIWPMDNTMQGFAWMATSTRDRRLKGNDDIRNYVFNNAWPNYVPGQKPSLQLLEKKIKNIRWPQLTDDMDILPAIKDPWKHPLLNLIRQCYHPMTVCDVEFDRANRFSDEKGRWPVIELPIPSGLAHRQLAVFNDTFSGDQIEVRWELRSGTAKGKVQDSGKQMLTVPLGEFQTFKISMRTPRKKGRAVLCLSAYKNNELCYTDSMTVFQIC